MSKQGRQIQSAKKYSKLKEFKIYAGGELKYSAVNQADGDYKVLKSYEDGRLKLVNSLAVQKTAPASGLWLDNSRPPLMLKNFSVTGSPVISADGIASGFSNDNFINTGFALSNLYNKKWTIKTRTIYRYLNNNSELGVTLLSNYGGLQWLTQGNLSIANANGENSLHRRFINKFIKWVFI